MEPRLRGISDDYRNETLYGTKPHIVAARHRVSPESGR